MSDAGASGVKVTLGSLVSGGRVQQDEGCIVATCKDAPSQEAGRRCLIMRLKVCELKPAPTALTGELCHDV